MNKVNTVTDCLNIIDMSIVQNTYFLSIEKLEEIHNFLINMSEMKLIRYMIVISAVLKYINSIVDENQSLNVEKYRELRKLITHIMIEINTKGDIDV